MHEITITEGNFALWLFFSYVVGMCNVQLMNYLANKGRKRLSLFSIIAVNIVFALTVWGVVFYYGTN